MTAAPESYVAIRPHEVLPRVLYAEPRKPLSMIIDERINTRGNR